MQAKQYGARSVEPSAEVIRELELPLRNMEYTIHAYLMDNGNRLDAETRVLLAGLRDSLALVAYRTQKPEKEYQASGA